MVSGLAFRDARELWTGTLAPSHLSPDYADAMREELAPPCIPSMVLGSPLTPNQGFSSQ